MQAWAAVAIAQVVLIAISLWRLGRAEGRTIWWPGVALFAIAALAMLVLVRDGGYHGAIAIFGIVVLASDALFLGGALVTSLCTRAAPATPPAEPAEPAPAEPAPAEPAPAAPDLEDAS